MTHHFSATLQIIGINPYVPVPPAVLESIFTAAGRKAGPIPVKGSVNGRAYRQTLVRYQGDWRLYINMLMLPDSPRRIGEQLDIAIAYDPDDRSIELHPALDAALKANVNAKKTFDSLRPSLQKEIKRYIAGLKSEDAVARNVQRAIDFLNGKGRFIGRDSIHD